MSKLKYSDDIDIPVQKRTPGEIEGYDRSADGLDELEKRTWGEQDYNGDDPSAAVREGENTPDDWTDPASNGFTNNYTGDKDGKGGGNISRITGVLKRGGPAGAIIAFLLGLASIVSFFGGPGLLIVHVAEIVNEKFNYQLASMDARTKRIFHAKLNNTTTGMCKPVTIRCKFATFSDKELERFKKAGIEMETDGKTKIIGRNKVTAMKFQGKTISPKDFLRAYKEDVHFNVAVKTGFNPKYAGLHDKISLKLFAREKISRGPPFEDAESDEKRAEKIKETTTEGSDGGSMENVKTCAENDQACKDEKANNEEKAKQATGELDDMVEESKNSKSSLASKVLEDVNASKVGGKIAKGAVNAVKITGVIDSACTIYGSIKMTSYAAKTLRAVQLARFAMIFLTTASQIKAGDAKPEDVSYLGTMFTKTVQDQKGNFSKSATDSFGYRYAAFNDRGMDDIASESVAGINLAGELGGVVNAVLNLLHGREAADNTCKFLGNPFVQIGSAVLGGIVGFFTGGLTISAGVIAQGALGVAFNLAAAVLPAMIADMIAGKMVGENTYGERAGNMFVSGSGGVHSSIARKGANAPLTRAQAVAYAEQSRVVAKEYADYDRATLSPFDASNPNTFMGSIYSQFVPVLGSGNTAAVKIVQLPLKVFGSTLSNITPEAHALEVDRYDECQDPDYNDMGGVALATDPFCNPVAGIPPQYLDEDPDKIKERLINNESINKETGEPADTGAGKKYKEFIELCIERDTPLGSTEEEHGSAKDRGADCIIDEKKAAAGGDERTKVDYYLDYMDNRVNTVMEDGYMETLDGGGGGDTTESAGTGAAAAGTPANTQPSGQGWTLKEGVDYSGIACPGGEAGTVETHAITKFKVRICPTIDGIARVASINAVNIDNLVKAAKADGVTLTGSSFRSYDEQMALRRQNCPDPINSPSSACSPPTAKPGSSMHERGLAIDFKGCGTRATACYKWLAANASKYGMYNYDPEPWHWSTSGG